MAIDTYMRVVPHGLIWTGEEPGLGMGTSVRVQITIPRKGQFHRKAWALFNTLHGYYQHAMDQPVPLDTFRRWLTVRAGFCDAMPDGTLLPRSLAYSRMDNEEFSRLYNAVIDFAVSDFLPTVCSREDLDFQIEMLLTGYA